MKSLLAPYKYHAWGNRAGSLLVYSIMEKDTQQKPCFSGITLDSVIKEKTLHPIPTSKLEKYHYLDEMHHIAWQFPTNNSYFKKILGLFNGQGNDANLKVRFQNIIHEYVNINELQEYVAHSKSKLLGTLELNEYQKKLIKGGIDVVTHILRSKDFVVDIHNVKNQSMKEIITAVKEYTGAEIIEKEQQLLCTLKKDWNFGFKTQKIVAARAYEDRWGNYEYSFSLSLMTKEVYKGAENISTDDLGLEEDFFFIDDEN